MSEFHADLAIRTDVVAGGAAGDISVSDITTRDVLKSVMHLQGDGTNLTGAEDLTSEFEIDSDGTINNGGGTATTDGFLIVIWLAADELGGGLNRS